MGRKKSPSDPLRATATKVAWKDWIKKNPDKIHLVPPEKLPKQDWLIELYKEYPQFCCTSVISSSGLQTIADHVFTYKPEFRHLPYVQKYVTHGSYYHALSINVVTFEEAIERVKVLGKKLDLCSSQKCELLVLFGERAMEILEAPSIQKIIDDSSDSTLIDVFRARPELIVYCNARRITPKLLFKVRAVRPEIDAYVAALI